MLQPDESAVQKSKGEGQCGQLSRISGRDKGGKKWTRVRSYQETGSTNAGRKRVW